MTNIITKKTDDGQLFLEISTEIYSPQAVLQTAYKFTDKCYLNVAPYTENIYRVYFKATKQNNFTLEDVIDDFWNELIDQQVRIITEKSFGQIRDEIVKKAFAPID